MKTIHAISLVLICLSLSANDGQAAKMYPPPDAEESLLAYPSGPYPLDNMANVNPGFNIYLDRSGTGHLQSRTVKDVTSFIKDGSPLIKNWVDRTSFANEGKGYTQLNLSEAKRFWGEPREHMAAGHLFYTFDAHSHWNKEPNIYHLDLEFVGTGQIKAYRIRGIGILHPSWVDS